MDMMNPPSGPFIPIGQAILSAPVAFADGVALSVPFDQLIFNKGDSLKFPNPPIVNTPLGVGPGFWLVQAQFALSVAPATSVLAQLAMGSGSQIDQASCKWGSVNAGSLALNSMQFNSYTPLQAGNVFAGLQLLITGTGTAGNVTAAKILVFRLGQA